MNNDSELCEQLKALLVETLMLQVTAADIGDHQPLFGEGGLGLDSVDALQIVVMLDKHFGLKITDTQVAQHAMKSVSSMSAAVAKHRGATA